MHISESINKICLLKFKVKKIKVEDFKKDAIVSLSYKQYEVYY